MGRELEKRESGSIFADGTQYVLALGVIGVMLYVIGLPAFVILFFAAFSFFLWKLFGSGSSSDTRKIFEFYLAANEILRDDERRWYGFELQEAIARGEKILRSMPAAPPLLHFAIGALYQKMGDHSSAERNLAAVVSEGKINEAAIVFPSNELREYVRILRKIEREPAEAPQTSAAVRSLERLRKNKGRKLLEFSRVQIQDNAHRDPAELSGNGHQQFVSFRDDGPDDVSGEHGDPRSFGSNSAVRRSDDRDPGTHVSDAVYETAGDRSLPARKPISEVLQDIYDDKIQ